VAHYPHASPTSSRNAGNATESAECNRIAAPGSQSVFHDVYPPSFFPGSELVPFALLKPLSMMLKSALDTKIGAFPIGTLW